MGSLSFPEPVYFTNPSPVTSSGQHEQGTELLGVEPPTATNIGSLSFPDPVYFIIPSLLTSSGQNTPMSRYGTVSFNALPDIKLKANKTRNGNLIEKYNNIIGSKYSIRSLENGIFEIQNESDIFKIHINHLRDRIYLKTEISTNKNPLYFGNTSGYENQISEFLSSLDIDFITSSKNIISPQQIDIFIPSHKLGIEFNGIYWHSELFKIKKYHLNKTNECIKKGINLIHIFEDDWILKNDIVKSIIRNKLNKTENRIFARNCKIEEIDTKTAKLFLEENHIQGFSSSSIKVGLFYKSELVSIMTFGNKYIKKIKEFELSRFCSKINTIVIGGAEKLFSYVLKKYNPPKIISYSDLSIFGGSLYEKIGFKFNKLSKPNYYWVVNGQRYHRFTFNKKKLIRDGHDASKSETEIMHSLGHIEYGDVVRNRGYMKITNINSYMLFTNDVLIFYHRYFPLPKEMAFWECWKSCYHQDPYIQKCLQMDIYQI